MLMHSVARPSPTAHYTKRLSDKILVAFHLACDQRDIDIASELLHVLDSWRSGIRSSRPVKLVVSSKVWSQHTNGFGRYDMRRMAAEGVIIIVAMPL